MTHAIDWFEIPCQDLPRAQRFYETVLGRPMRREAMGPGQGAVFAYAPPASGGCLIERPDRCVAPNAGACIYLNCDPGLDNAVARVAAAGGTVIDPCITLPDGRGFIAHLRDTEGNTVGLHAGQRG